MRHTENIGGNGWISSLGLVGKLRCHFSREAEKHYQGKLGIGGKACSSQEARRVFPGLSGTGDWARCQPSLERCGLYPGEVPVLRRQKETWMSPDPDSLRAQRLHGDQAWCSGKPNKLFQSTRVLVSASKQ